MEITIGLASRVAQISSSGLFNICYQMLMDYIPTNPKLDKNVKLIKEIKNIR